MSWWEIPGELDLIEGLLLDSDILPPIEIRYFREKPWKWTVERSVIRHLGALAGAVSTGVINWDMSLSDLATRMTVDKTAPLPDDGVPLECRGCRRYAGRYGWATVDCDGDPTCADCVLRPMVRDTDAMIEVAR